MIADGSTEMERKTTTASQPIAWIDLMYRIGHKIAPWD
jgi:hypothetical protein